MVMTDDGARMTVVLPALNEQATVGKQVAALLAHEDLRRAGLEEVIVVDNGSTDATAAKARAAGARVVAEPRRGYGAACLAGVLAVAPGNVVLLMDADGSDDVDGAAQVARLVANGEADLAMGSRTRGHVTRGALTPQQRVGNALTVLLLRPLAGVRVSDLGPMKAMRRERLLALELRELTYGWSAELLLKAGRAGYHVVEIPVDYHRRAGGKSKVAGTVRGTLGAALAILATLWRYARWQPAHPIPAPHDTILAAER
jgi:glycosyltransferase involved in cell wall biosynthesis